MEVSAGARIDRYLLVEPLGEGGQGSVWKAMDTLDASRVVALKLVSIAQSKPTQLERVRREARALAKLEHPSLVRCHGLFEDFKASVLGLVLELVDGKSLADALDDARFTSPLRWAVLQHVAQALVHLHERHIIHRDLKPENIVLAEQFWTTPSDPNTVKIIDFGIAAEEGNPNPLTAYGNVIGTPAYMAPELIDATYFAGGRPTPAVDVFAFGVVAWILLVGGHPTGLAAESTLVDYAMEYRKVVTGERSWARTGGPPFVAQCLEPRPERRLQSGADVIRAMQGAPLPSEKETVAIGGQRGTLEASPAPELFRNPGVAPTLQELAGGPARVARNEPATGKYVAIAGLLILSVAVLVAVGGALFALASKMEASPSATSTPSGFAALPTKSPPVPSPSGVPVHTIDGCVPEDGRMCACCQSNHDCLGAPCSALLAPTDSFVLRVAGGGTGTTSIATLVPDGEVCMWTSRSPGDKRCTPTSTTEPGTRPSARLPVTWRDVSANGINIQVNDATGAEVTSRLSVTRPDINQRGVLCTGFNVRMPEGSRVALVGLFLDPPDEPAPQLCPPKRR